MKAIFASKMYKASNNKDKIRAAIADPVNSELVQQLREYLDEESIPAPPVDDTISDDVADVEDVVDEDVESDESTGDTDESSEEVDEGADSSEDAESSDSESDDTSEEVAEATRIAASTECHCNVDGDVIKGTLNSRQDTAGVVRVSVKDCELWVYYNDKINLNNIMGPVIDLLNSTGYTYLDFNRLARTDNAIVFQIESASSTHEMKPIESEVADE